MDSVHCSVVKNKKIVHDDCTFRANNSKTCTYDDLKITAAQDFSSILVTYSGRSFQIESTIDGYAEMQTRVEIEPGVFVGCGTFATLLK